MYLPEVEIKDSEKGTVEDRNPTMPGPYHDTQGQIGGNNWAPGCGCQPLLPTR